MKNKELIETMLMNHRLWLDGKGGECADFSGMDLSDMDLSGLDLSGAIFKNANLWLADLTGTILKNTCFQKANLISTRLTRADLSDADLSGANLREAYLNEAILRKTNLEDADLSYAVLDDVDLRDSDISGANLNGVDLCPVRLPFMGSTIFDNDTGRWITPMYHNGSDFVCEVIENDITTEAVFTAYELKNIPGQR